MTNSNSRLILSTVDWSSSIDVTHFCLTNVNWSTWDQKWKLKLRLSYIDEEKLALSTTSRNMWRRGSWWEDLGKRARYSCVTHSSSNGRIPGSAKVSPDGGEAFSLYDPLCPVYSYLQTVLSLHENALSRYFHVLYKSTAWRQPGGDGKRGQW